MRRLFMRIVIREATAKHTEWGASLNAWYKIAKQAHWKNFAEFRSRWRNSDVVGRFVVFDISHNRCRLIASIKYAWRMVYIRRKHARKSIMPFLTLLRWKSFAR